MKKILVLGCTGSIGTSTLNIIREFSRDFSVVGLTAHSSEEKLIELDLEEPHTSHFYYIYINKDEKEFILQREEVSEVKWYDINVAINMMQNNDDSIITSPRILKLLKILNNKKL